jgi:hypothetical protein
MEWQWINIHLKLIYNNNDPSRLILIQNTGCFFFTNLKPAKHDAIYKEINNVRKGERYGNIRSVATSQVDRRGIQGREMKEEGRDRRYKENTLDASSANARRPPVSAARNWEGIDESRRWGFSLLSLLDTSCVLD